MRLFPDDDLWIHGVKAYDSQDDKNPELKDAISVLRQWDFKTSKESVAMTLAHFYGTHYGQKGKTN